MISSWVNGCFYGHLAANSALANFISQAMIYSGSSEESMSEGTGPGRDRRGRPGKRRPTMTDVARLAGVSQSSVSLVLNNMSGARISDATRKKVL